ncbi:MAG: hypothetical protein H8E38_12090 [SAR324 cluster bacterium]|nr:hypothetical protein [SAR324 cluster bacterium]MBL7035212.1 hypothetical protein [SAR324 cluster bacterium]
MLSLWVFTGLAALLILQRLWELGLSKRNEELMRRQGGYERFPEHYRFMLALHISWFAAMLLEAWYFQRNPSLWVLIVCILGLVLGQILRYLAIHTLGERWSTRIYVVRGKPLIKHGIYKFVRHPNYWGVMLEIICVPLIHAAYGTALIWSLANLVLLRHRIRLEERALK